MLFAIGGRQHQVNAANTLLSSCGGGQKQGDVFKGRYCISEYERALRLKLDVHAVLEMDTRWSTKPVAQAVVNRESTKGCGGLDYTIAPREVGDGWVRPELNRSLLAALFQNALERST